MPDDPAGLPIPDGVTPELISTVDILTLVTAAGPLDISIAPDGTEGFDDLDRSRQALSYRGRVVSVAALADLIRSKGAAGRAKDLLVLPALRAHLRAMQRREARK